MPQPKENLYTIDYIYSLPEDKRVELIDGIIYDMSAPKRIHQDISMSLSKQLSEAVDKNNGECKVYAAPFGVKLDDYNYVEPDISLICDKNKLTDDGCVGVPELIMEIVSPSSVRNDYVLKLNKYINAGIFEYWIIDPSEKRIMVYLKSNNYIPSIYRISDEIKVDIIKNCNIKLDIYNM